MDGHKENVLNHKEDKTVFEERARYDSPANIFTIKRPAVPKYVFIDEIIKFSFTMKVFFYQKNTSFTIKNSCSVEKLSR